MSCSRDGWQVYAPAAISWRPNPPPRNATGDRGIGRAIVRANDRANDRSVAASATPPYSVEALSAVLRFQRGCTQPARLVRHYRFVSAKGSPAGDRIGGETHGRP